MRRPRKGCDVLDFHDDYNFSHEYNRDGDEFCCLNCDREYHADYNAVARNLDFWLPARRSLATAKNIARKPLRTGTSLVLEGQPVTLP